MIGTHFTYAPEETVRLARSFARELKRNDVVALYGELGCGKTRFVKGVCEEFQAATPATSPSFVFLNRYEGKDNAGKELLLYHFDLYRVRSLEEIYELGLEEFLRAGGICFVEWADVLGDLLPRTRYDVRFSYAEREEHRKIDIAAHGMRST